MAGLLDWIWKFAASTGNPYLDVFLLSLVGNLSIFFPIPYFLVVFTIIVSIPSVNIFPLAAVGAIGATAGKLLSYGIGYGGRIGLGARYQKRFDSLRKLLGGSAFVAALIFAASPLPDDIVFIPLGMMRYSLFKTLFACFLGKLILTFSVAWFAKYSGETIRWLFGTASSVALPIYLGMVAAVSLLLIFIDWEKILTRKKKEK